MQHSVDVEPRHRGAGKRRQEHPPKRVAHRDAVAALQRLNHETTVFTVSGNLFALHPGIDPGLYEVEHYLPAPFNKA